MQNHGARLLLSQCHFLFFQRPTWLWHFVLEFKKRVRILRQLMCALSCLHDTQVLLFPYTIWVVVQVTDPQMVYGDVVRAVVAIDPHDPLGMSCIPPLQRL